MGGFVLFIGPLVAYRLIWKLRAGQKPITQ
jgi:hypothetical protein